MGKKSKQKQKKKGSSNPNANASIPNLNFPGKGGECRHFPASLGNPTKAHFDAMGFFFFYRMNHGPWNGSNSTAFEQFAAQWPELIDETMKQMLVSSGATMVLDGNQIDVVRDMAALVLKFDMFINISNMSESTLNQVAYDNFKSISEMCDNEQQVIKFFADRVPCGCLDAKLDEAMSCERQGRCWNDACSKFQPDRNMFDCGRCKLVKYCSKECQVAHWKKHKKTCLEFGLQKGTN